MSILERLPPDVMSLLLTYVEPVDLVRLRIACGNTMPVVKRRMLAVKFAKRASSHWLMLSRRMVCPAILQDNHVPLETWQVREEKRRKRWHDHINLLSPCDKHTLLEFISDQIQHVNDVAALLYYWHTCYRLNWWCELQELGAISRNSIVASRDLDNRMEHLSFMIHTSFQLRYDGFLGFDNMLADPNNVQADFWDFNKGDLSYDLEFADVLVFLCSLYRLKQYSAPAVLQRLNSLLSRCCRFDLLVLTRVLQLDGRNPQILQKYMSNTLSFSEDILDAFGESEPYVQEMLQSLASVQKENIIAVVKKLCEGE